MNSGEDVYELSCTLTGRADQYDPSSCKGPLLTQKSTSARLRKKSEMMKSSAFDVSPPRVEISPPVIDWGQRHLYFPSPAFLTVANTYNESILHLFEPSSTNTRFYACNFTEEEFFFICLRHQKDSFIGSDNHSEDTKSGEKTESGNKRTGSLGSGKLLLSVMKVR
ncbi:TRANSMEMBRANE PROTEIN 131-like protein [Salix purpurea]|uniref:TRANSMEMBRANE PROTEIN 131-like protein n=1 Tax=Salix purpurea TaxID=77065 RepID=A0A9Q0WXQ2_SALPP|nr:TRANSMEMBRANE PROTEIN 131-like protein [Salix purpurea]